MKTISAADANRYFSKLLRDVQAGETVTITSRGKPVATLGPALDEEAERLRKQKAWQKFQEHLKGQPTRRLGRFDRDELYDEDR